MRTFSRDDGSHARRLTNVWCQDGMMTPQFLKELRRALISVYIFCGDASQHNNGYWFLCRDTSQDIFVVLASPFCSDHSTSAYLSPFAVRRMNLEGMEDVIYRIEDSSFRTTIEYLQECKHLTYAGGYYQSRVRAMGIEEWLPDENV